MENYSYDRVINLKNLIYKIIKQFKKIIIVTVIFALIGAGYSYMNKIKYSKISSALSSNKAQAIIDYNINEDNINNYIESKELENKYNDYVNYNPSFQYGYVSELYYTVSDGINEANNIKAYLLSDEVINKLVKDNNLTTNSKYFTVNELLKDSISFTLASKNESVNNDTLKISIAALNEDSAANLGNQIKELLNNYNSKLIYVSNNVDLNNVSNNEDLTKFTTTITNLTDKNTSTLSSFSTAELIYLNSIDSDLVEYPSAKLVRNTVLFGLVGAVLCVIYFALRYIFSPKFQDINEIEYKNVNVYGKINLTKYNSKLDKLFGKDKCNYYESIVSKIKLDASNHDCKELVLATTLDNEETIKEVVDKLKKELNIKDIYVGVLDNSKFFDLCNNDNTYVVYVEKLDKTKVKDVDNLARLSNKLNLNTLGFVIVD